jgi:hypothetical protein
VIDQFVKAQGVDSETALGDAGAPAGAAARRTLDLLIGAMGAYRHNL